MKIKFSDLLNAVKYFESISKHGSVDITINNTEHCITIFDIDQSNMKRRAKLYAETTNRTATVEEERWLRGDN